MYGTETKSHLLVSTTVYCFTDSQLRLLAKGWLSLSDVRAGYWDLWPQRALTQIFSTTQTLSHSETPLTSVSGLVLQLVEPLEKILAVCIDHCHENIRRPHAWSTHHSSWVGSGHLNSLWHYDSDTAVWEPRNRDSCITGRRSPLFCYIYTFVSQ